MSYSETILYYTVKVVITFIIIIIIIIITIIMFYYLQCYATENAVYENLQTHTEIFKCRLYAIIFVSTDSHSLI